MRTLRLIALTALWCALTREVTAMNIGLGMIISFVLVRAFGGAAVRVSPAQPRSSVNRWRKPLWAVELVGYFLWEMILANLRIAAALLRPTAELRPAIVAVPVDVGSEAELAVLSDLVTLTPGTLTLDVSPEGDTLYVHVMGAPDPAAVRDDIRDGLAVRVRRLFS